MKEIQRLSLDMQFAKSQYKSDESGNLVYYSDHAAIVAALQEQVQKLGMFKDAFYVWHDKTDWVQTDKRFDVLVPWGKHRADVLKEYIERLEEQVQKLAADQQNASDIMLYAANNIAYAIFNLSDKKLTDLKRGLSDTTCPTDSALLAERELRNFAAQLLAGEQP